MPACTEASELRWLRLFLALSRAEAEMIAPAARAREILELICSHLGAAGGLLAYPEAGGTTAVLRVPAGAPAGLGRRLLEAIDAGAPASEDPRGLVRLSRPLDSGGELHLLLDLPAEAIEGLGVADADVLRAVAELLGRP